MKLSAADLLLLASCCLLLPACYYLLHIQGILASSSRLVSTGLHLARSEAGVTCAVSPSSEAASSVGEAESANSEKCLS